MQHNFSEFGLSKELVKALDDLQIFIPTEIQQKAIPILLEQKTDCIALAKTGTGKTIAYGLPLLQLIDCNNNDIQAIIISPTRELGHQIFDNLLKFATYIPELKIQSICGGVPIKPQIENLASSTHIVVATPGRLLDLMQRKAIDISKCRFLILDEADEIAISHHESLETILAVLPKDKKNWLFSATMPGVVKQLVQNFMSHKAIHLSVDMQTIGNLCIDHQFIVVDPIEKLDVLMHFLSSRESERGIIFCKTKAAVNKLAKNLAIHKFSSGALHGSLTQPIRDRIMAQFRANQIHLLIATDLAARGLDVEANSFVIHYHLPDVLETYVHRSGRTARSGAKGLSLSILQNEERHLIPNFEQELGLKFVEYEKPNTSNIEDNKAYLWAKQIFKTKPNTEVSNEMKQKIKTIFHHLTKDELIEKLIGSIYKKL